jgi:hypothetical protein
VHTFLIANASRLFCSTGSCYLEERCASPSYIQDLCALFPKSHSILIIRSKILCHSHLKIVGQLRSTAFSPPSIFDQCPMPTNQRWPWDCQSVQPRIGSRLLFPPALRSMFLRRTLKGTGSPDGLDSSWHIWIDLGLKKGRGWFLNFVGAPSIIRWNNCISCSIWNSELAVLASCWCFTKWVGALLPNPPRQWETRAGGWRNLSDPADQKDTKKTTGPLNNGGAQEIICHDSLAGCWCTAELGLA